MWKMNEPPTSLTYTRGDGSEFKIDMTELTELYGQVQDQLTGTTPVSVDALCETLARRVERNEPDETHPV